MAAEGAAIHLPQQEMTAQKLADVLAGLDRPRLLELASHAHALARPAQLPGWPICVWHWQTNSNTAATSGQKQRERT
jgi:hypothetical protein